MLLVDTFLERAKANGQKTLGVSADALSVMIDYSWPGNIRELQSAVQFTLIKARGGIVQVHHLSPQVRGGAVISNNPQSPASTTSPASPGEQAPSGKLDVNSVKEALEKTGGNKVKAAALLGVGRATLYRFLDKNKEPANAAGVSVKQSR